MVDNESVEKIVSQIEDDGEREIRSILEKADRTASDMLERAAAKGEEAAGKILKEAREKGETQHRRLLSSVSIEVKRAKLKAREEVVSSITETVGKELEKVRGREDYALILAELVLEGVKGLEGGEFQVYADRRDLEVLEKKVFPSLRKRAGDEGIKVETLEAVPLEKSSIGGARVGVPGGKVIYDNTFEARMYRLRDDIRNVIFDEVFEPEGREGSGSA